MQLYNQTYPAFSRQWTGKSTKLEGTRRPKLISTVDKGTHASDAQALDSEFFSKLEAKFPGGGQSSKHCFPALAARYVHRHAIEGLVVTNLYRYSLSTAVFCRHNMIVNVCIGDVRAGNATNCKTWRADWASVAKKFGA